MQLKHLVKTLDEMSDEELLERLRQVRHNREVAKPVAKAKAAKVEKRASNKKLNTARDLLENLSLEDREALLKQLQGE